MTFFRQIFAVFRTSFNVFTTCFWRFWTYFWRFSNHFLTTFRPISKFFKTYFWQFFQTSLMDFLWPSEIPSMDFLRSSKNQSFPIDGFSMIREKVVMIHRWPIDRLFMEFLLSIDGLHWEPNPVKSIDGHAQPSEVHRWTCPTQWSPSIHMRPVLIKVTSVCFVEQKHIWLIWEGWNFFRLRETNFLRKLFGCEKIFF